MDKNKLPDGILQVSVNGTDHRHVTLVLTKKELAITSLLAVLRIVEINNMESVKLVYKDKTLVTIVRD